MSFLKLVHFVFMAAYSGIAQAELTNYDWDGLSPRAEIHGWCEMFGPTNQALFNVGESFTPGGWLDVTRLASLPIMAIVTGAGAGQGAVSIQFQGAMSLFDQVIRDEPSDMQFSANVNDTNAEETQETIDVARWNYIRFWSIDNMSAIAVTLQLRTHDGVRPITLPEGTGV